MQFLVEADKVLTNGLRPSRFFQIAFYSSLDPSSLADPASGARGCSTKPFGNCGQI